VSLFKEINKLKIKIRIEITNRDCSLFKSKLQFKSFFFNILKISFGFVINICLIRFYKKSPAKIGYFKYLFLKGLYRWQSQ